MSSTDSTEYETVSPELDAMVGDVLGEFLDALAVGENPGVVICVEDAQSARYEASFTEDGIESCLGAAQKFITDHSTGVKSDGVSSLVRYAIAYVGAVDLKEGGYLDAILVSFFELGLKSAYSAYVEIENIGDEERFAWAPPQAAGAETALI
ncbi:hypothetical protein KPC83_00050 [Collinsella sp. zg1085]|uniref:hypothetical protein n=1 Tax=Collinsella sp. zg1085 TaxID=2844380 RepID=UPI001C0D1638|nr:hypothetical protein [Collinsella sp. zg1085]QWT17610.1 hypothetical protein KPC83_00050 [Collinsella sp. zg1085]